MEVAKSTLCELLNAGFVVGCEVSPLGMTVSIETSAHGDLKDLTTLRRRCVDGGEAEAV